MRYIVVSAAVVLAVLGGTGCERPAAAPVDLDAGIAAARERQQTDGPRVALPLFQQLLVAARVQGSRRHEGLILGYIGTTYKNLADYTQAMAFHERALAIKRETGDEVEVAKTLSNIGLVEEAEGRCDHALDHYRQSLAIFTRLDTPRFAASVLNNEGLCYDLIGDYRKSRAVYDQALAIHRQQHNDKGESETLGNLGGVALLLGRYAEAAARYEESLAISTRLDDRQSMTLDLINLGLARLGYGELTVAGAHLRRARTLAREAGLLREEADAARGLAAWSEQGGRYDEARAALADAIAAYGKAGLAHERVDALHSLGLLDLATGDLAGAASELERASTEAEALHYHAGHTAALLALSELELRRHNPEAAAQAADRALVAARAVGDAASATTAMATLSRARAAQGRIGDAVAAAVAAVREALPTGSPALAANAHLAHADALVASSEFSRAAAEFGEVIAQPTTAEIPDLSWRAWFGRGRALEAEGQRDRALADYLRAVGVIEQVRGQLGTDRARSGFLDDKRDVYTALVRLLLRLGRVRDAFQAAERLRAEAYRDLVQRSVVLGAAGGSSVPASILAAMRQLQSSMETELRRPASEQRGEAVTLYQDELRAAEAAWHEAVEASARDPRWAALRARFEQPSAADVQRRIGPGAALVEFVVDADQTAAFVLTAHALHARVLPVGRRELRARIELLRGVLARPNDPGWTPLAERLDHDLLAPLRNAGWLSGITRLYIVPHTELNYLPFALLRHATGSGPRFLVDDVAPVLLPAASVLARSQPGRQAGEGLFALAPARTKLPFAREEVDAVAALFPSSPEVLSGKAAREDRFKREVGRFRVIHLATHGFFNRVNPLFSGLELEPGGEDDGQLQVFEILGLPLVADLVTLSACDTAMAGGEVSDLPAGEELVGLTRAFLSAGGRHVLATLWAVSDRPTSRLMTEFYGAARTRPLPEALALVQRKHAHAAGADADPWAWAPFVMAAGSEFTETKPLSP